MPDLWCVGIDTKWSLYNELKQRKVVANGWRGTGDLSYLFRRSNIDFFNFDNRKRAYLNAMRGLLSIDGLKAGDIVVGYEGRTPKGVCVIPDCALYIYDDMGQWTDVTPGDTDPNGPSYRKGHFEYANCFYPVHWIDIQGLGLAENQFPVYPVGVPGIPRRKPNNLITINCLRDVTVALNALNLNPNAVCNHSKTEEIMNHIVASRNREQIEKIQSVLENVTPQIVLQGPPGTSKTYLAKLFASYFKYETEIVQFHPSYNYEDFVRGIEVSTPTGATTPNYKTINRILAKIALAAIENPDKKYVLIIDEINRANLASVLGELIYALEYRGEPVNSVYGLNSLSGNEPDYKLTIPRDNLYIIGTMNTADRSIGHIDYAVRRRFAFIPMLPKIEDIDSYHNLRKTGIKDIAKALFIAVEKLFVVENKETNDRIHAKTLAPDFHADDVQPGHTYFMADECKKLIGKFIYQVYPLLREYYKDGILVKPSDETNLGFQIDGVSNFITIEPPMLPQELLERLQVLCPSASENHGGGIEPDEEDTD